MLPWEPLAEAGTPEGDRLRLMRRGSEYSIRLTGGNELMNSRLSGSEEALATLAAEHLGEAPRVLIGGLGMGFTLRAMQAARPGARITVAEIVPELVGWARAEMAEVFGDSLTGVEIAVADVAELIARGGWDAILLDVDNGPDGLTRPGNDGLYSDAGLRAARRALRPGGVLTVWSAHPARGFAGRMERAGFTVREVPVRAGRGRGARHVVWVGRSDGR
ncbi:spermidine synthase [Roseobacter sp. HKCCA0434]|uniref:spermidine synthase n=1 Tax=Roseobacter sp. HKCCA0434 TaxID=3079297 RepID=UPI002905832F|nr:spermidine synthase [Roseobacter sp. HKCCA0434]